MPSEPQRQFTLCLDYISLLIYFIWIIKQGYHVFNTLGFLFKSVTSAGEDGRLP